MPAGAVDDEVEFGAAIRKIGGVGGAGRGREPVEAAVAGAEVVVPVPDRIGLEQLGGDAGVLAGLVPGGVVLQGGGAGVGGHTDHDGAPVADVSFESLALNDDALHGELLFRLTENTGTILVHERVRDKILELGITTLKFIRPENWVRL